jgi:hypothetical protein
MIAYVLQEHSHAVEPYSALDTAVVNLLTTGRFPEAFSQQTVRKWEQSMNTRSPATTQSQRWQPFSAEAVSNVAQAHLEEWVDKPGNRLLAY